MKLTIILKKRGKLSFKQRLMRVNTEVFEEFPVIKTERLTLREITITDAAAIFKMRSSGRINQFIARENMHSLDDSIDLIHNSMQLFTQKNGIAWAGVLRDNKEIIGTCGFNSIDFQNRRAEIGGELSVDYWGKNIAMEAVEAIIDFGLNQLKLHTIEAKLSPSNRGAIYLLEKLGFEKEAHFKESVYFNGLYLDMAVYTLIRGNEKLHL